MSQIERGDAVGMVASANRMDAQTRTAAMHGTRDGEGRALNALVLQVEYYFSRENLANDVYLVSQMNAEMFVPVAVIATFARVRALTDDVQLVIHAMRMSSKVVLDEAGQRVRPNFRLERTTLILRNIPSGEQPETLQAFLEDELGVVGIRGVRAEIGDNWFLEFGGEAESVAALHLVQGKIYPGTGRAIAACLKSETLLRGTFSRTAPSEGGASPAPSTPHDNASLSDVTFETAFQPSPFDLGYPRTDAPLHLGYYPMYYPAMQHDQQYHYGAFYVPHEFASRTTSTAPHPHHQGRGRGRGRAYRAVSHHYVPRGGPHYYESRGNAQYYEQRGGAHHYDRPRPKKPDPTTHPDTLTKPDPSLAPKPEHWHTNTSASASASASTNTNPNTNPNTKTKTNPE